MKKQLTKEIEVEEKKQEPIDFTKYYVKPHNKISRPVTKEDLPNLIGSEDEMGIIQVLYNLCYTRHGVHNGALAVAHSQINYTDPLKLFVTRDMEVICNCKITRHTNHTIDSEEGCLSFFYLKKTIVQRFNKCDVEYQTLVFTHKEDGKLEVTLSEVIKESLSGIRARIFQHENDHEDAKFIFNTEDYDKNDDQTAGGDSDESNREKSGVSGDIA